MTRDSIILTDPKTIKETKSVSIDMDIINNTKLISDIITSIRDKYPLESITINKIASIVTSIMELIEVSDVKGVQQKILVIHIFRQIVLLMPEDDIKRLDILNFIENDGVDNLIEIIISASKGELKLNTIIKTSITCMHSFSNYFIRLDKYMKKNKK